jgi:hypothetical protein
LKKYQKQGVKCFWGDILKNGFITHTNAPQAIRVKKGLLRTSTRRRQQQTNAPQAIRVKEGLVRTKRFGWGVKF